MIKQSLEEAKEQSSTVTSSKSAGRSSMVLRNGHLKIGYQLWPKGEKRRKDFNIAWIQTLPINSCTFEQSKVIQEKLLLILHGKDNVLLPKGFTEYIYHVGNANELNSIIRKELIPGGKVSIEEDKRYSSLQWTRWMMNMVWEKLHATYQSKDRALQEYLETRSKSSILVQSISTTHCLHLALRKRKITQDELHQKVRLTPRVPRVVLKSNSQYGLQNPENQDARSSWEPSSDSKKLRRNL